jgi:hypothetical protein
MATIGAAAAGCQRAKNIAHDTPLTQAEALTLAIELANQKCMQLYSAAPFDSSTYGISFREGRWHWGELDVMGVHGYAAMVSFDLSGGDRRVEVFVSSDALRPKR